VSSTTAAAALRLPMDHPCRGQVHALDICGILVSRSAEREASKSIFQGFAAVGPFGSLSDMDAVFFQLVRSLASSDATHPCMYAAVLPGHVRLVDDDGEKGAGQRLLERLQLTIRRDPRLATIPIAVAVSRYYGGVPLGKKRWHLIGSVADDALAAVTREWFEKNT
jgi:putative IMPACT (imprinted ancient) family translation regulator